MKQVQRREMQQFHDLKDMGIDETKNKRVKIRKIKCEICKTFCIIEQHANIKMKVICKK